MMTYIAVAQDGISHFTFSPVSDRIKLLVHDPQPNRNMDPSISIFISISLQSKKRKDPELFGADDTYWD
jgi:hypothetical protein